MAFWTVVFFGDNGNYIDVWIIKITIKKNRIDMDVCFFQIFLGWIFY